MRRGVLPAVILCAMLGGCFVSHKPLITPDTADHPFPAAAHVTSEDNDNDHQLATADGYYTITDELGDKRFLVKAMGDGLYVAQECRPDIVENACSYSLLALDGGKVEEFDFAEACTNQSAALHADGLIAGRDANDDCVVDNFEKLVTIFMRLHTPVAKPDRVYARAAAD